MQKKDRSTIGRAAVLGLIGLAPSPRQTRLPWLLLIVALVLPGLTLTPRDSVTTASAAGQPSISLLSTINYQRSQNYVSGTGFGANEPITVYWNTIGGPVLATGTTSANGSFSQLIFYIPNYPLGTYAIYVAGGNSGAVAQQSFQIIPYLAITPSPPDHTYPQGSTIQIWERGFAANETVWVKWNCATPNCSGQLMGTATTDGTGNAIFTTTVPQTATYGNYTIGGLGLTSQAFTSTYFHVIPALTITPNTGLPGATATISGISYGANESISLQWNCASIPCNSSPVLGAAIADANGDFSTSVTIPSTATNGSYTIGGTGQTTTSFATTSYTVSIPPTVTPTPTLTPTGTPAPTPTPTSTTLRADTFSRANSSGGWGIASDGNTWALMSGTTAPGGTVGISGNKGILAQSSASLFNLLGPAVTSADQEGLVRWSVDGTSATAGILLRAQNSANYYLARYSGANTIQLRKVVAGVSTYTTAFSFTPIVGSLYWMRFRVQGSTLAIKVWADGTAEPTAWGFTTTDTSLTVPGSVGLYGFAVTSTSNTFDSFTASAATPATPTPTSTPTPTHTPVPTSTPTLTSTPTPTNTPAPTPTPTLVPPAAPSNLTAMTISSSEIDLSWTNTDPSTAGFIIQRSLDGVLWTTLAGNVPGTATSYQDLTVAPGTNYFYQMQATNGAGSSLVSNTASATTPPVPTSTPTPTNTPVPIPTPTMTPTNTPIPTPTLTSTPTPTNTPVPTPTPTLAPPAAPSNLTAMTISSSEIDLSWTNTDPSTTGFIIQRSLDGVLWTTLAGNVPGTATSYQDLTVAPGTNYFYQMQATNGAGSSLVSNTASATTPPVPTSTPTPTNTPVPIPTPTMTPTNTPIPTPTLTSTPTPTNTPAPTPTPTLVPPAAPSNLTAMTISSSEIDLSWTNTDPSTAGFIIQRSLDGVLWTTLAGNVPGTATSYQDLTVAPGTNYFYQMQATNGAGSSLVSNTASATTPPVPTSTPTPTNTPVPIPTPTMTPTNTPIPTPTLTSTPTPTNTPVPTPTPTLAPPAAPSNLTAMTISSSEIDLSWTNTDPSTTGFIIQRSLDGVLWTTLAGNVPGTATSYQDLTVAPGTNYFYQMQATNGAGSSLVSNTASATTPPVPTSTPTPTNTPVPIPTPTMTPTNTPVPTPTLTSTPTPTNTPVPTPTGTPAPTPTPTSTTLRADTFTRANSSGGWGIASDGNTWALMSGTTAPGGTVGISGNKGILAQSSASLFNLLGPAVTSADQEGLVRWSVDGTSATAGILLRAQNSANYYLARYSGANTIQLRKVVAGVSTYTTAFSLTLTVKKLYWLRFRVQGSTLAIKVWADGTAEPTAWGFTTTDTSLTVPGSVGLYGFAVTSTSNTFDNFSVVGL